MRSVRHILLVEDSSRDAELVMGALSANHIANEVVHLRDGAEALDYLYRRARFIERAHDHPTLILLDLKLPKVDGLEVVRQIKSDPMLKSIPVVMMTSSRREEDLVRSYEFGVNAYVVKPMKFQDFVDAVKQLGGFWAVVNEVPANLRGHVAP